LHMACFMLCQVQDNLGKQGLPSRVPDRVQGLLGIQTKWA